MNNPNISLSDASFDLLPEDEARHSIFVLLGFACSICMIFVGLLGVLGNIAAIRYFGRRIAVRSTVNVLLTALSTFDLLLLLTGTPIYSILGIYSFYDNQILLMTLAYCTGVLYPISNFAQMGSVWTMTTISIERYIGVCRPFLARRELTAKRARICVIAIAIVSSAYNACRFWEYSLVKGDVQPLLRADAAYISIYVHWMYFVFVFALPFSTIVVFNCLVVVGVRRAVVNRPRCQLNMQQRHDRKTTLMLLVVVSIFLFCNSLSWPLNAYESFAEEAASDNAEFDFVSDLNNLLVLAHPFLNILVYMYFSASFRNQCFPTFGSGSSGWRAAVSGYSSAYDLSRRQDFSTTGDYYSHFPCMSTPTTARSSMAPHIQPLLRPSRNSSQIRSVSLTCLDNSRRATRLLL